jgi:DNA-binding PadR family transcriptional regulator
MPAKNYPSQEIINHPIEEKKRYDHIILWMLYNNKECEWSDFLQSPLKIPTSSLSRHLNLLKNEGYLTKISKGHYKITSGGKKQFHDLSKADIRKRKLSYPPETILKVGRNYRDWILWMVYNNNYCKWSDFLEEPLSINQSSLSKAMNLMMKSGFIRKDPERKEYRITQSGKIEYSRMLHDYNLDRQTILEEESRRIEDVTKDTINFFDTYNINDGRTQFRFVNNILKLDYNRVESMLKNETDFHKILFFLSINHPDKYPNYISPIEFSKEYRIKENTLTYYIDQIVENNIYPIKFFELRATPNRHYYFQENEKLETMIRAITEDYITEFTYLSRLFARSFDFDVLVNEISDEVCTFLLDNNLKNALKEFLPDYINYLAYKIEAERELVESYDKLEGIIWQNVSEMAKIRSSVNGANQYEQQIAEINKKIELNPKKIELYYLKIQLMISYGQFDEIFMFLEDMIKFFPNNEKDIKMKKASILKRNNEIKAGFKIINDLLQNDPNDVELLVYKAYWLQYLNKKEESINIIRNLIEQYPKTGTYYDTYGEILMYFEEYQNAVNQFQKAIDLGTDEWYINQSHIKLGICYKEVGNKDLATKFLRMGKELTASSLSENNIKQKWLKIADIFLAEMEDL